MKKLFKWLTPVVVLVMICTFAAMLTACKPASEQPAPVAAPNYKIYYNLDGVNFRGEEAEVRMASSDGLYRASFASEGEMVDLFFENYATIEMVDKSDILAMVVDENNLVTDVLDLRDVSGDVACYRYYVKEIHEDHILTNSSASLRAQKLTLRIDENTKYFDVAPGPMAGMPTQLTEGCEITALQSKSGVLTHVFVTPPFQKKPVYWNINRQYDSASKLTKREPDALGRYTYTFVVDGQQVELQCKTLKIASKVDSYAARCMYLEFDEEGYISNARGPSNSTGGSSICSWYHITELTEGGLIAEKFASGSDHGTVKEVFFTKDVQILDVSTKDENAGKPTTLRVNDQIHCIRDFTGDVCLVYVVKRYADTDIYWNLERLYSTNTKSTKRIPDADGYYHFTMHHNGEYVELRTNDKSIANTIDSRSAKCCALTVKDGIITYADHPKVAPVTLWASNYWITEIAENGTITANKEDDYLTATMAENCKVYDMSKYANKLGEETELRTGDKVYPLKGLDGAVQTIYVIDRYMDSALYWNLDRSYDSTNKVTKRTPDADGYYNFRMLKDREIVYVRTNDKTIANSIDSWVACGLTLDGDEVVKAVKFNKVYLYEGGSFASYHHITKLTDTKVTAKKIITAADQGHIDSRYFSTHCKIYDISPTAKVVGEPTTLRVGDQIQGFMNINKRITAVYVIARSADVPMYWNVNRDTERKPAADGYYYLTMATGGKQVELKAKDAAIVETIDGRSSKVIGLAVDGDIITATYLPTKTISGFDGVFASGYKITKISGNEITATKGQNTVTGTLLKGCGIYDVSGLETFVGAAAKPQVGDIIYGLIGEDGKVTTLFITGKTVSSEIYWNLSPAASRTPDASGYYHITLAVNGQTKTFKTTSADLIKKIDSEESRCVGLKLSGDEILNVYPGANVEGYTGGMTDIWCDVIAISGTTYTLRNNILTHDNYSDEYKVEIPTDCPVYHGSTGQPTTLKVDDRVICLKNDSGKGAYVVVVNRPGETARTAYCQACEKDATWYVWDGNTALADGKHYYLAENTAQLATGSIAADTTVCMDLNGKTLTGDSSILRNFNIKGHFALMDSAGNGKVISTKENASLAPVFNVNPDGSFKLYGGTLTAKYSAERGGVGLVQEGIFYMYGGVLEGGSTYSTATNRGGGNLEILSNSTFYMYGGTIRNGHSVSYGGNVSGFASAKLYLLGGTIEGGVSEMGGNDVSAKGNITVGGNMKIGEVYMFSGKLIKVSSDKPLVSGAGIGVILEKPGVFTEAISTTTAGYFHSCTADEIFQDTDGKLSIGMQVVHKHCECNGANDQHTCNNAQVWEPWPSDNNWESGKYYYLDADVKDMPKIEVAAGQSLHLCLNGHTYTGKSSTFRLFVVYGELSICDHASSGTVKATYSTTGKAAPVFRVYKGGEFRVYGGNFTCTRQMLEAGLGVVDGGLMYLYDGHFYGGNVNTTAANQGGGNVNIFSSGRLVMYGGTIEGGTSALNGANMHMNNSKSVFEMYGGKITGGTAPNGSISTKGTVILGGDAVIEGGSIYLMTGAKIEIKDDFTGTATVEMQDGTGKCGTSAIDAIGKIFAKAGYAIVQTGKDLYLEEA